MNQREIAKLAGVSCATVSRVINKDSKVAPETAKRVWEVISQYGYVQNSVARSLRMSQTRTVGFLIPDLSNPFFPGVLKGIEAVCAQEHYNLILQNTDENKQKERDSIETLLSSRVDGVVAVVVDQAGQQLKRLSILNVPIVVIDRRIKNSSYDTVTIANKQGVEEAISYLVELGHTKIATIHGKTSITPGIERLEGYFSGMERHSLTLRDEYVVNGDFLETMGYVKTKELLSLSDPPTALITANNMLTMGAYRALSDLKVRVPQDLSLIGFDDFPLAAYLSPPITVIDRPTSKMGEVACRLLFKRIREGVAEGPREIVMPTQLKKRHSCSYPRE